MTTKRHTSANQTQIARVREIWDGMFHHNLHSGVHGVVKVEVTIQDGTIQKICHATEKIEKAYEPR